MRRLTRLYPAARRSRHVAEALEPRTLLSAVMVKDLDTVGASSNPQGVNFNDAYYFAATTSEYGTELWKSDGTAAGTVLVKDINPGGGSSSPAEFTLWGGKLYFAAYTPAVGTEVWASDGTSGGTYLVKDVDPFRTQSSSPLYLQAAEGGIFFWQQSGQLNLFRTDGTADGTVAITDPTFGHSVGLDPGELDLKYHYSTIVGDTLIFSAKGLFGWGLWKATTTGSSRAAVIKNFGVDRPKYLHTVGTQVIFSAPGNGPSSGFVLWRSDGTPAGTTTLKDDSLHELDATNYSSYTGGYVGTLNGFAYYLASSNGQAGLWKSDGTDAGTTFVKAVYFDVYADGVAADGKLFFLTSDALWRTDGTPAGTQVIKNLSLEYSSLSDNILVAVGHTLFFRATDDTRGLELWETDGTASGTGVVIDIDPGPAGSNPAAMTAVGDTLLFQAYDSVRGAELWRSDGSEIGTSLVSDIRPGTADASPAYLTDAGGNLYFAAAYGADPTAVALWRSDGSADGTVSVASYPSYPGNAHPLISSLTSFNNQILYGYNESSGRHLWTSNGTPGGTTLLRNIDPRFDSYSLGSHPYIILGGKLLFSASDDKGSEPWITDGTTAGTQRLLDINTPGIAGSYPTGFAAAGGTVYFSAIDDSHGNELWKSDGTSAGTVLVKDILPGAASSNPTSEVVVGGTLYFTASDGTSSRLWKSDGTPGGTTTVGTVATYGPLINFKGSLLFSAFGTDGNNALWTSDGSAAGTVRVTTIGGGYFGLSGYNASVGNSILFTTTNNASGQELWRTDGTAIGTALVKDINPGPSGSSPSNFTAFGNLVFFTADDGTGGQELWRSDGTTAGTKRVQDIFPGAASSYPSSLTVSGGALYFAATDPDHGSELWRLAPPIARAGGNYTAAFDGSVVLDASASTDPDPSEVLAYAWDLDGDGVFGETGAAAARGDEVGTRPVFSAAGLGGGAYPVAVRVTDSAGLSATAGATVTVADPVGVSAAPGSRYTLTGPADGKVLAVTGGTITLTQDLSAAYPNLSIQVSGTSAVQINAPQHLAALTLNGPGAAVAFGGTSDLAGLSFAGGAVPVDVPLPAEPIPAPVPPAAPPRLSVGDVRRAEGQSGWTAFTFPVTLDRPAAGVVKVSYATANRGATKGSDYEAAAGTLTFQPGQTRKTITVRIAGDRRAEADETFALTLYDATGAAVADGTGVGTIVNDDAPPPAPPRLSVGGVTTTEGNNGRRAVTFDVSLDRPTAGAVAVRYATANGSAAAGTDYAAAVGTLTFAPGETRRRVTVYVAGDKTREADETFFLTLSAPVNALIDNGKGLAIIRNDD